MELGFSSAVAPALHRGLITTSEQVTINTPATGSVNESGRCLLPNIQRPKTTSRAVAHDFLRQQKRISPSSAATTAASTMKLREKNTMRMVLLVVAASWPDTPSTDWDV